MNPAMISTIVSTLIIVIWQRYPDSLADAAASRRDQGAAALRGDYRLHDSGVYGLAS